KAYIILNKHTSKIKELLNVAFDENHPPSKTSPLVDDDLDEDQAIKVAEKKVLENNIEYETLKVDQIVNIKESKNHPLENNLKNVNEALKELQVKIIAMQEELNQFVANDVWELVPQPKNITIIGTKWLYRNKLDENGVVSRNKARLESIRILIVYACALDFKLFQMNVKCAFRNGFINEEFKMSMMDELNFFLGLQIKQMEDDIFFNQSKFIKEMLKTFGLEDSKPMKTPMSSNTKLTKDEECESVDNTKYRGMIGAIDLSKNPVQHSRTKHIEIHHHFLRDNVQKGHISIEKVSSEDNIADILAKPLKRESFNYLRLGLGMMEHIHIIVLFFSSSLDSSRCSISCRDNLINSSEVFKAFLIGEMDNKTSIPSKSWSKLFSKNPPLEAAPVSRASP
ncbi:retrovirus-related pol polyprotein from transposon TNT 1-94, partial [Tanacetum coccineum]